jgi:uncharacterized protein (DUF1499 family)
MQPGGFLRRLWRGSDAARPSRLAWLVFILGVGAALAALAAGQLNRAGAIDYSVGFLVLGWAAFVSIAALVLGIVALIRAATGARRRSWGWGLAGLLIAIVWLAVPVYYVTVLYPRVPPIHDITTDFEHPPEFVAIAPLRANAPNGVAYGGPEVAAQQQKGFPDIGPLRFAKSPADVFPAALAAAQGVGWQIVNTAAEQGRIEASLRSLFFGFIDDVVIRVAADGAGTRVDVRSASRVGGSDLGANARHVRAYLAALKARVGD